MNPPRRHVTGTNGIGTHMFPSAKQFGASNVSYPDQLNSRLHIRRSNPTLACMRFLLLALILLATSTAISIAGESVQFNRDIRPILSEKCWFCHGPDAEQREADLRLDLEPKADQQNIFTLPLEKSVFHQRITSTDPETQMPPPDSGKALTAEEIQLLKRWQEKGAKYEGHWAFSPPRASALKKAENDNWSRNNIDLFVLQRLQQEALTPSEQADKHTLLRRLSLDLTGLPPNKTQIQAFVNDKSPSAYEQAVERLLNSDQYGEHMARFWLDAARYADTNGYQYDLEREQWVWRDWVIHALNTNMPFDQFTIEQLAGDLLPGSTDQQKLATGFHRNHPITIEGGVIDEEYRTEYVVDRVATTATVWMGLTMTCGRCHDHKYDPISQKDFYRFFAFFNNVSERGLNGFNPKAQVPSPYMTRQLEETNQAIELADQQLKQSAKRAGITLNQLQQPPVVENHWLVVVPDKMNSKGKADFNIKEDKSVLLTGPNIPNDTYELIINSDETTISALQIEALRDASTVNGGAGRGSNGNFVLSEIEIEVASADQPSMFQKVQIATADADYSQANYSIDLAIDGKVDRTGWAVDGNTKIEDRTAVFAFKEPVGFAAGTILRVMMKHEYGGSHQIARFRTALHCSQKPPPPIAFGKIISKPDEKRSDAENRQLRDWWLVTQGSKEVRAALAKLQQLEKQRTQLSTGYPATMVMNELPTPRKTHVLIRGEYDKLGMEVQAETPEALPPMPAEYPRNRLGLAKWLVMPNHPLTARVTVNRFWQQFFGTGLVKTAADFGSQGDWPSHPKLLDWLAVNFVESGWDVKALVKQIVMSSTYRQSGITSEESLLQDPENRLLSRGPRLRLDAEVIRDSALFASGLLSPRVGGPSVFPYHPAGLWQEINNRPGYSRTYKQDRGEKLYRRSMYTFWKRTVPPPSMAAFDAPEREYCQISRSRTNTPLQAFVMLHDPQFVEAARHLAGRMLASADDDEERIGEGFQRCHTRPPTQQELSVLLSELNARRKQYKSSAGSANQLLAVGESEVDSSLPPNELAAWTSVARVMMNLSEFVTKP